MFRQGRARRKGGERKPPRPDNRVRLRPGRPRRHNLGPDSRVGDRTPVPNSNNQRRAFRCSRPLKRFGTPRGWRSRGASRCLRSAASICCSSTPGFSPGGRAAGGTGRGGGPSRLRWCCCLAPLSCRWWRIAASQAGRNRPRRSSLRCRPGRTGAAEAPAGKPAPGQDPVAESRTEGVRPAVSAAAAEAAFDEALAARRAGAGGGGRRGLSAGPGRLRRAGRCAARGGRPARAGRHGAGPRRPGGRGTVLSRSPAPFRRPRQRHRGGERPGRPRLCEGGRRSARAGRAPAGRGPRHLPEGDLGAPAAPMSRWRGPNSPPTPQGRAGSTATPPASISGQGCRTGPTTPATARADSGPGSEGSNRCA